MVLAVAGAFAVACGRNVDGETVGVGEADRSGDASSGGTEAGNGTVDARTSDGGVEDDGGLEDGGTTPLPQAATPVFTRLRVPIWGRGRS